MALPRLSLLPRTVGCRRLRGRAAVAPRATRVTAATFASLTISDVLQLAYRELIDTTRQLTGAIRRRRDGRRTDEVAARDPRRHRQLGQPDAWLRDSRACAPRGVLPR